MKHILFLFLIISSLALGEVKGIKFEDLNSDHWAYPQIKSLVEKGIIQENRFRFEGNEKVSRYEFAQELAKSLDYIDLKKANKEDLNILESLMFEFSQELNKIGFDSSTLINRIDTLNETVDLLRERVADNEKMIEELKKRVEALE